VQRKKEKMARLAELQR
jgi:hypothetical protein